MRKLEFEGTSKPSMGKSALNDADEILDSMTNLSGRMRIMKQASRMSQDELPFTTYNESFGTQTDHNRSKSLSGNIHPPEKNDIIIKGLDLSNVRDHALSHGNLVSEATKKSDDQSSSVLNKNSLEDL